MHTLRITDFILIIIYKSKSLKYLTVFTGYDGFFLTIQKSESPNGGVITFSTASKNGARILYKRS